MLRYSLCWTLIKIVFISSASAHKEILPIPIINEIQLSNTEALYLNECLQGKEHMSYEDTINTIIELEHFYTLIRNSDYSMYLPSLMVDKAWHHHILNTKM